MPLGLPPREKVLLSSVGWMVTDETTYTTQTVSPGGWHCRRKKMLEGGKARIFVNKISTELVNKHDYLVSSQLFARKVYSSYVVMCINHCLLLW